MIAPVAVGLLDSGVAADLGEVVAAKRFIGDSEPSSAIATAASSGHGATLARIIIRAAPESRLYDAQVFRDSSITSAAAVAAGLNWLAAQGVALVNMSFGLRRDRRVLREACANAKAAGCVLLAAVPARGPAVYPAAYDSVLRITGDARCAFGEVSHLATAQADFGACPRGSEAVSSNTRIGGASFAVAHITGILARYLGEGGQKDDICAYLKRIARYHGPERRSASGD